MVETESGSSRSVILSCGNPREMSRLRNNAMPYHSRAGA
jgi:hypothetical protein